MNTNRRHGPLKEKEQITLRLDKELMSRARAQMEETHTRLTDLIERGLELALKEVDQDLPAITTKVRFLVNNTTKAQQLWLRRFLAFLVMDQVCELSTTDLIFRRFMLEYLESLETWDNLLADCFERYGKVSAEARA